MYSLQEMTTLENATLELIFNTKIVAKLVSRPKILQNPEISVTIPGNICTESLSLQNFHYQGDFLTHFRQRELNLRPRPFYLKHQPDIDHSTRAILVNWIVAVINEYNFDTETLFLSVSYVDRILSQLVVSRERLQLVGISAVYVAAKYEEARPPGVNKFACVGGLHFDTTKIVKMERLFLRALSYDLHLPTSYTFAIACGFLTDTPHLLKYLTLYICELSLHEAEPYLQYLPSLISSASHAFARYLLGYPIWSKRLEELTLYRLEDLKQIILFLSKTHYRATKRFLGATRKKFMQEQYHQVALIGPVCMDDDFFDQVVYKYNSF